MKRETSVSSHFACQPQPPRPHSGDTCELSPLPRHQANQDTRPPVRPSEAPIPGSQKASPGAQDRPLLGLSLAWPALAKTPALTVNSCLGHQLPCQGSDLHKGTPPAASSSQPSGIPAPPTPFPLLGDPHRPQDSALGLGAWASIVSPTDAVPSCHSAVPNSLS